MSHQSELIEKDIEAYLKQHEHKELLRFLTCGSVDDGKSTLIGRLLHDSKMIYEDQLAAVRQDSERIGSAGEELDLALLMDGLKAEREQGITIDVAYRYFSTSRRKFIIADTPGHEQYTRNMVTGASTANLAVILIDARHGVLAQTKRHSFIASLLGIRHVVVAVNKMDLVDWKEQRFEEIKREYNAFAARLDIADLHFIPMSALKGDNVVERSENMPWFRGGPLMEHLETVQISGDRNLVDMRFPVQWVNRPDLNFRGFCGTMASGVVRPGDEVMALPSRKTSRVKRLVSFDGDLEQAFPPLSTTIELEDEIDVSRGDMIVAPGNVPTVDKVFDAMLVWMGEEPMVPGRDYMFMHTTNMVVGAVEKLRYQVDINTLRRQGSETLPLNGIGRVKVELARPIAYDPYKQNRSTGAFIVIDRMTNVTVGAGMILARKTSDDKDNWDREAVAAAAARKAVGLVDSNARSEAYGHKPATVLLTGIAASGKTTIAVELEKLLFEQGKKVTLLDGQTMRTTVSKDLGYSAPEREENLRRAAEVAHLMNDAGLIVVAAFTSPSARARDRARKAVEPNAFIEVFIDTPIEVCRERDTKGIYERAEAGEISMLPGLTGHYEAPTAPEVHIDTTKVSAVDAAKIIAEKIASLT